MLLRDPSTFLSIRATGEPWWIAEVAGTALRTASPHTGRFSLAGCVGTAMNEDAISEQTAELRDILRKRAPDITWHTVHCDHDHEGVLWVRVRAMRTERLVQFVLLVLDSERAKTTAIAARIIGEALRLLRNKN